MKNKQLKGQFVKPLDKSELVKITGGINVTPEKSEDTLSKENEAKKDVAPILIGGVLIGAVIQLPK